MKRILFIISFLAILPAYCLAQLVVTGRVLSAADNRPVLNASVFINNATIGSKTDTAGMFTLRNLKPGKYELVVSCVGFKPYNQSLIVRNDNIALTDIIITAKVASLKEVTITAHTDPNREKYYNWFKDEFLGTSALAQDCKILNPQLLDFDYDEQTVTLKASSVDFLLIENEALGYRLKYLLTDFLLQAKDPNEKKVYYRGPVSFEEMNGSPSQERRWKRARAEVYENSPKHFLRAAINDRLDADAFRVQKLVVYANPERQSDSLINTKIKFYQSLKTGDVSRRDSLAYWVKKSKLPKILEKLMPDPLKRKDFIRPTDEPGKYEIVGAMEGLLVAYDKSRHYRMNDQFAYLYNPANKENTLIKFNSQNRAFYINGVLSDPYALVYYGVWGRNRVAELLPQDYEADQYQSALADTADITNAVVGKLKAFSGSHQQEKAYLHFDKPYYATGDTIYFKAYLAMGERHELSTISGVLHAELIGPDNKIAQSIKLQVMNGVAWGDFALPDTLAAGNYRVRAYTQWMRNEGTSGFFEKTILVGSLQHSITPEISRVSENAVPGSQATLKADIAFLPEGGTLVNGISSKVAFKATSVTGLGIPVKGKILDNDNKEVTTFASAHLGMGYFYLAPQPGKSYHAKLTYADGSESTADLPRSEDKGIVLTVNNDSVAIVSVRVQASSATYLENKNKEYSLLIWSGGKAVTVPCVLDSAVITMDIIKRRLHTGIATITLFSPENEPLCERLIFVQNYDQLTLDVSTDKTSYNKRDKVSIKLNARNRADSLVSGHFSVSVTDESKVPADENAETTILSSLLLTSDLKGHVEQPNYYFTDINSKKLGELDLVMLTNGYRRFEWKQLLHNAYPAIAYQPENSLAIKGIATTPGGRVIANGTVSLIAPQGGPVLSTNTDVNGNFAFNNLAFADSTKFILQAVNARGKDNTQIIYKVEKDEVPVSSQVYSTRTLNEQQLQADTALQTYMQNSEKRQVELNKLGTGSGRYLKGVTIKDRKAEKPTMDPKFGVADQVVNGDQIPYGGSLSLRLMSLLHGVQLTNGGLTLLRPGGPVKIFINGFPAKSIDEVGTDQVDQVALFTEPGLYGMDGVLSITTRYGWHPDKKPKVRSLKEVNIKGVKIDNDYPSTSMLGAGHADQVVHAKDLQPGGASLSSSLMSKLKVVKWKPAGGPYFTPYLVGSLGPMQIYINGAQAERIDDISASGVETVEVLLPPNSHIYGPGSAAGVILITTKQGWQPGDTEPHKVRALKEVNIKGVKANDNYASSNLGGPGHADQVLRRSEFHGGGLFSDMFNGTLRGVTFEGPIGNRKAYLAMNLRTGGNKPMLLVVDGVISDMSVDAVNPNSIETIEVLKYTSASIYGMDGGRGVLVITSRKGGDEKLNLVSTGFLPVTIRGFYKAREFYAPKYNVPAANTDRDLRATIFWKPELVTDKNGTVSFDYYNSDGTGSYRVVVEGMDEKGNIGRKVYHYKVN